MNKLNKLFLKFGKRNSLIFGFVFLVVIIAATTVSVLAYNNYSAIGVVFDDTKKVVEYGAKVDTKSFVKSSTGTIKAFPSLDTKKIGDATLSFNVCSEQLCKDVPFIVTVKDSKAPIITLKADSVDLIVGDKFDPNSNITSVVDPVDGAIKSFKVDGSVDTSKEGSYELKVIATDVNNLSTSKSFNVIVKPKPVEPVVAPTQTPSAPASSNNNYIPNNSGGANGDINNASGGSATDDNPCIMWYIDGGCMQHKNDPILCVGGEDPNMECNQYTTPLGNSGKTFADKYQAGAWAESVWNNPNSEWYFKKYCAFQCYTVWYNLPNGKSYQVWTVDFYN